MNGHTTTPYPTDLLMTAAAIPHQRHRLELGRRPFLITYTIVCDSRTLAPVASETSPTACIRASRIRKL